MIPHILIRHLAGSKANRIEQFQLDGAHELIIGRGSAANVAFDAELDDTVSRRHAIIRIIQSDRPTFTIADLGSSNGVRVNGWPVQTEQTLRPDDIVELSPGGPAFRVAVEVESLCPTDAAPAPQAPMLQRRPNGDPGRLAGKPDPAAAGLEKSRSGPRYASIAMVTAVMAAALGAGALSYQRVLNDGRLRIVPRSQTQASASTARQAIAPHRSIAIPAVAVVAVPAAAALPPAVAPANMAKTAPAAIVWLEARWRLYDTFTGKPVFQKMVTRKGQRLPCFVALADGRIVPWLTTADEEHTNRPIGGVIQGTGFVISGAGSIITSRRVAAGWTVRYREAGDANSQALLFHITDDPARDPFGTLIDLTAPDQAVRLIPWIPGEGGHLFRSRYPEEIGASTSGLQGRNTMLDVQFPFSHVGTPARLVRVAADADLAELKIDVDRQLPVIALSNSTDARVGERITTLGYAGTLSTSRDTSLDEAAAIDSPEIAALEGRLPNPPEVTSAAGTISGFERPASRADGAGAAGGPTSGWSGDIYQLSMNDTHLADGGPVLDETGRALGVLISDSTGGTTHLYAYPISLVRALLRPQ